ncbi:MAG: TlpA disulfide reductase family protein [Actinomycetota bacterium]
MAKKSRSKAAASQPTKGSATGRKRPVRKKKKSVPVFPILVSVLVALGIAATVMSRGGSSGNPAASAKVTVTGGGLSKAPEQGAADPAIGAQIPEVAGRSFDGKDVVIRRDGRPKAILFVTHWCHVCRQEVPAVQAWLDEHPVPEGTDIISVATSTDPSGENYPPDKWLEREGWQLPVMVDDKNNSAAGAYGLQAFPLWVFSDADGKVVMRVSGMFEPEQVWGVLEQLASSSPTK